ncbi:hypothetical protein CANCADRAFT_104687 [Tortispora caseinolytica NRRL Y-17796]|uniref:Acireductone dioxygenase n=1 Tax=Tortispora caseinolytica NRRL Y-17796 TaxID=767744 RepID=A0A1E4TEV1_9ASCO|nr:hypothetical protein CANCADRAFT_104687 [Tortispora caseinolytica NRRL Y-17796]
MKAYYHDELPGDQREMHDSGRPVDESTLEKIGVLYKYALPTDSGEVPEEIEALAKERNYKNRDCVTISPSSFGDAYEDKIRIFYEEHIHEDEEIRYVVDGNGFFDVRSLDDHWIRCYVEKGDLLILPEGIYHRFTPAISNYIKAVRLFKEEPKWIALPRPQEENPSRTSYLNSIAA